MDPAASDKERLAYSQASRNTAQHIRSTAATPAAAQSPQTSPPGKRTRTMNETTDAVALAEPPARSPNILSPDLAGWSQGEKSLFRANEEARAIAQNLIDTVDDHAHLRQAKILLLFETGRKPDADGRVTRSKTKKATPRMRLLTGGAVGEDTQADFEITINADIWPTLDATAKAGTVDHALTHAAATIAGKYMAEAKAMDLARELGADHIETHNDTRDEKGRVLVRYLKRRGETGAGGEGYSDQPAAWRIRKHSLEDHTTVIARWGPWEGALQELVDVWAPPDDGQLALNLKDLAIGTTAERSPAGQLVITVDLDVKTIVSAKRTEATIAIDECTDIETLKRAKAEGLKGDWRRAAVAKRIEELTKDAA